MTFDDGETPPNPGQDAIAEIVDGLVASDMADIELPHIVVCRDPKSGVTTHQGPYPSGMAALAAADRDAAIERAHENELEYAVSPLIPVTVDEEAHAGHWVVSVVVSVDPTSSYVLSRGVVAGLDAARLFAEQSMIAAAPYGPTEAVFAVAERCDIDYPDRNPVYLPADAQDRRIAVADASVGLRAWTASPVSTSIEADS